MSHFTLLVVGADVDKQLEPFNEAIRVARYVAKTKKQLIAEEKASLKQSKKKLTEYLKDPEEYKKGCSNPDHIKWLTEELPLQLKATDEELHKKALEWYEPEDIGKKGEVYSTYNPNSKWDWYQVGGRWAGFFKLKAGRTGEVGEKSWCNEGKEIPKDRVDVAKKGDIDFEGMKADSLKKANETYDLFEALLKSDPVKAEKEAYWNYGVENTSGKRSKWTPETRKQYVERCGMPTTFAVLKDGLWYERGKMGWWAFVSNEKKGNKWDAEFWKLLEELSDDTLLTVVDAHI